MGAPDTAAKPEQGKARSGVVSTELGKRVASALVLIPLALITAYLGGQAFAWFWFAAGVAMTVEWTAMAKVRPLRPVQAVAAAGCAALTALLVAGGSFSASVGVVAAAVLLLALLAQGRTGKAWAVTGFLYGLVIVVVPPTVREHPNLGLAGLLWMFAVVWSTDIAAYFTGRSLGGPKLWPRVSPKKTWSGFLGGVLAAAIAGFLVAWSVQRLGIMPPFSLRNVIMLSIVASVASQLGDLGESAMKRRFDVKDSSHLIPGHGGVMDRLDGFWAVALILGAVLLLLKLSSAVPA
ncbi:phosphatidate cytidylyltransferase [Microvirga pudoricolor]|uniref:phosphatidate cytidylyltransferase n=1 Tax=Microvirga pudoricolor TaxID=2778729 RepID=UPI00194DD2BD|nr:phosphatidate cytidylyltransferase [Microvirga pudoricolor]MBM6595769.1 phosphatidate cytidylyltransferase [Microvirga pudoricolor]